MSGLNASLSIAVQSIIAQDGALQATNNNIANANTPGYSRQLVTLQSVTPTNEGKFSVGNGVVLEGFQSVRDELLQMRIQQQTSTQSSANLQQSTMQQIQPVFTTSTQDVGTRMSALFSSLSSLSTSPGNSSSREAVLSAGQNLAAAFNAASDALTSQQTGLNTQVTSDVGQINKLAQQIAALNPQLAALKQSGQDGGSLQDQQDQLVLSLSKLTSIAITQTNGGETVTTGNGTPLVVGSQGFTLQSAAGSDGNQHVLDQNGTDVTASLKSGDLGAAIQMRDQTIGGSTGLLSKLDTLASQFAGAINAAQASGTDQSGATGTALFAIKGAGPAITAANITMATVDPTKIAAGSDGSAGSNGNLANFAAVQTNPLVPGGQTPIHAYASLVFQVGSLSASASADSSATTASLLQLNDQRNAISGVSIDEESTNLIRYQQAYQAAARVVSTIQTLFAVTMSMGTAAAA